MQSPRRIGKYVVEQALGAGSFATVWLAVDEILETRVAIKVLADNWARQPDVHRRFIEEAKILRRIDHERIVQVYVVDELDDGRPYFVMGWADRGSLHDRLADWQRRATTLPIEQVVDLGIEMATCLGVVHDFGVVHRDVKPSNLLFRSVRSHQRTAARRAGIAISDESMLLGDFGLAKDLAVASGFTLAAGTPAYMAPEQSGASADLDHRADLFSATAVIYELLCGRPAFSAETLSGVRRSRQQSFTTPVAELRPDAPASLVELITIGLSTQPENRFASAHELIERLQAARDEHLARAGATGAGTLTSASALPASPLPTGIVGRVADLIDRALTGATTIADELRAIRAHLVGPVVVTYVDVAAGDDVTIGNVDVRAASAPDGALLADSDLVVAPVAASEEIAALLRDVVGGPVAVLAPEEADYYVNLVAAARHSTVAASAALARLDQLLAHAELSAVRPQLTDEIDSLRLDFPALGEIDVLRRDAAGRTPMARSLRDEARRVLLESDPRRRLGLAPGTAIDDVRASAQRSVEKWRTLINTNRVPFLSRGAAEVIERSYDRLWAETLSASALAELSGETSTGG